MYRGSGFLVDYAYTAHRGVIDVVADARFDGLWDADFGARSADDELIPLVLELVAGIRRAYKPFATTSGSAQPTDTLVTKVVLGTFGCLPACDRYFVDGFRSEGLKFSKLNGSFVQRVLDFCQEHLPALQKEQASIDRKERDSLSANEARGHVLLADRLSEGHKGAPRVGSVLGTTAYSRQEIPEGSHLPWRATSVFGQRSAPIDLNFSTDMSFLGLSPEPRSLSALNTLVRDAS